jgi:hypothetical protein
MSMECGVNSPGWGVKFQTMILSFSNTFSFPRLSATTVSYLVKQ